MPGVGKTSAGSSTGRAALREGGWREAAGVSHNRSHRERCWVPREGRCCHARVKVWGGCKWGQQEEWAGKKEKEMNDLEEILGDHSRYGHRPAG